MLTGFDLVAVFVELLLEDEGAAEAADVLLTVDVADDAGLNAATA